ncbi:MAG: two-component sensor histidine kinase [Clostridiales bacterium GWF2_38_85]|nr:MAG: two-component sensor histidine kinase [Clostridiales bacterium GWF2_38_85]
MNIITDKVAVFILCIVFYLTNISDSKRIIPILIIIIISAAYSYFERFKLRTVAIAAFVVLTVYNPNYMYFLPLVAYDLFFDKEKWLWTALLIPIITNIRTFPLINTVWVFVFILITVFLKYRSVSLQKIKNKHTKLQDDSKEMALMLEIKNKELIEQQDNEINLATLNERNRIARDIHDNVGHMLSSSILQIGAILATAKDDTTKESLKSINTTLSNAMTSIRDSVHDLHEQSIDLYNEVRILVDKFTFCTVDLDYDVQSNPEKKLKYCFITVIKEALSNVIKHSNATKVSIILREHPALYQLVIQDNGTKPDRENSVGIGLTNIKDRVAAFNGNVNIMADKGFRIFISISKENKNGV